MGLGGLDLSKWSQDSRSSKTMIISRLSPSRLLGSIASTIHTPGFRCFISTTRILFISRRWETVVFEGDPADGKHLLSRVRLVYSKGYLPPTIYELHDTLAEEFNKLGDTGMSLIDAAEIAVRTIAGSLEDVSAPAAWS